MAADRRPPLVVEACRAERLHAETREFQRIRPTSELTGDGTDRLGEDISVFEEDGTTLHEPRRALPPADEWTLPSVCERLSTLEPWPTPPEWTPARRYRNRAFESAALDLALRQAGRTLPRCSGSSRGRSAS